MNPEQETSIIEAFEAQHLDSKIKNAQGDFFQLSDLIGAALAETTWNLTRNTKKALPNLRDVGHISAHSRRYTAQKADILKISQDCRIAIEEFLHLAGLILSSAPCVDFGLQINEFYKKGCQEKSSASTAAEIPHVLLLFVVDTEYPDPHRDEWQTKILPY